MPFFVAQKSPDVDHEHFIYVSNNAAECAKADGHAHPVSVNPETGEVFVSPVENHTHFVVGYSPDAYGPIPDPAPDVTAEPEADVVQKKADQFEMAWNAEEESIENGRDSVYFREGKQWPDDAKNALVAKKRTCLTINHVAPMVETLSGMYRRNRSDLRCFPTENGDVDIANVLTYVMKHITQSNGMDTEETEAFEDVVTPGRGLLDVYPDFDADIQGMIKVRHSQWDMTIFGPHLRKDLEDCGYFCRWSWVSQEMLVNMFPEHEDKINVMFGRWEQFTQGSADLSDQDSILNTTLFANSKSKELRLIECEEKIYYRLNVYVDPATAEAISDRELPRVFRGQIKSLKALRKYTRKLYNIRRTLICGDIVVEDGYVTRPVGPYQTGPSFYTFPIYAYKRGNRFEGKVERIKDPQREINKRRSQIVDIVNTSINNGWLVPKGAFGTQKAKNAFVQQVSTPGFVIEIPDMANVPSKIESSRVEPAIVQLELNSLQSFRETSNVNSEMLGVGSQYQSGSAMAHRLQQGLMGNEYLFDNMSQVKKRIGREILLWIQELYTPERIARIFFDQAKLEKIYMGDKEVDPADMQLVAEISQKLKEADLTKYDVTIGETGQSPTAQLANFDMMAELAGKGVPIPPEVFIEIAPIPQKQRILQMLSQAKEQQAADEDKKYNTEIQKTMIAAQSKRQG